MPNWREIPFVRLILPLIAGILLGMYSQASFHGFNWLLLILWVTLIPFLFSKRQFQKRWVFGVLSQIFILIFAYQRTVDQVEIKQDIHFQQFLLKSQSFVGQIIDKNISGERSRLKIDVEGVSDSSGQLIPCIGKILLYVPEDSDNSELAYGDRIIFQASPYAIGEPKNPEAFDFKRYWNLQQIYYQAFINDDQWQLLEQNTGHWLFSTTLEARDYFIRILEKHIPEKFKNELAVAKALILGKKDNLTTELKNAYANTGAMHVLAVSGLHVGLVYLGIAFLLNFFPWRHRYWKLIKTSLLIGVVWLFALITGGSPSVMRAATMFSFIIIGKAMKHHPSIYNTLTASAFCLLCFNPFLLFDVGFQLSYLAVTGIIYFQHKIYTLWIIDFPPGDYLWKLISVAIAAQITTLPISLYYFHQFPVYFWLSGLIVVPAATIVLGCGLLLFMVELTLPVFSFLPAILLFGTLWVMNAVIFLVQQIPFNLITGVWISFTVVLLLYLFLTALVLAANTKNFKWVVRGMAVVLLISINFAFTNVKKQSDRQIIFYHIKDKSLIDFINGKQLISIGSKDINNKALAFSAQHYRWSKGIHKYPFSAIDSISFQNDYLLYQNYFVQFFEKRIGIIHDQKLPDNVPKLKVDCLLLSQNPDISIKELTNRFEMETIIFDASNNYKSIRKWKTECRNERIKYYDINETGAFIISI